MLRLLTIVVLFAAIYTASAGRRSIQCGPNENVYTSTRLCKEANCGDPQRYPCDDYKEVPSCRCRVGYVRASPDGTGDCVSVCDPACAALSGGKANCR